MTSVIWSPQAIRDVESIRAFIAQDSPPYADLEARRIVAVVERLRMFPESGRRVSERPDSGIREIILSPYRVVYRLRDGAAEIVTVFRASRQFPESIRWLAPVALAWNHGFSDRELNDIRSLIVENEQGIIGAWHEHCGQR